MFGGILASYLETLPFSDEVPVGATTIVKWVDTSTMAADGLTKAMQCRQLIDLMKTGLLQVSWEKIP